MLTSRTNSPSWLIVTLLIAVPIALPIIVLIGAALAPGGRFIVYGPFMRGGELTSDGDVSFHEGLQARDPEVGYKDDFDVIDRMQAAGLELVAAIEMPANNLALIAQAPGG